MVVGASSTAPVRANFRLALLAKRQAQPAPAALACPEVALVPTPVAGAWMMAVAGLSTAPALPPTFAQWRRRVYP
eukprot:gene10112-10268_t